MPKFNYVVKNKEAKTIKGQEIVSSKGELISRLRERGLYIVSLTQKGEEDKESQDNLRKTKGKRISLKLQDLTFLARNLATMLSSGITLLRSLKLVSNQTESLKLAKVLQQCADDIRGGFSFKEAVKKYPNIFSKLWVGIIQVGEASGNLPFVLNKLADYLEIRMEFERKIKSALIYPIILIAASLIAVFIFIKIIFPKFKGLFKQFDIELPGLTKFILSAAGFLEKNFFLIIGFIILAFVAFVFLKKKPEIKLAIDKFILKIPFVADIMFLVYIERFTSILYILLESGLPLVYSLTVASDSVGNQVLQKRLQKVSERVKEGSSLSEELTKIGVFPVLVSEMAKIGEETGSMPDVFDKVSKHYSRELTTKINRLVSAFEPLMIVVMGVVIGTIVVALFLPMFRISTLQ
ncbi:MAG: type II secretion system F family protein [Candidatus Omnitrophica bacterium]|nr:type II secretion system F family protein [Candidatus Omnitrophota bacterium]